MADDGEKKLAYLCCCQRDVQDFPPRTSHDNFFLPGNLMLFCLFPEQLRSLLRRKNKSCDCCAPGMPTGRKSWGERAGWKRLIDLRELVTSIVSPNSSTVYKSSVGQGGWGETTSSRSLNARDSKEHREADAHQRTTALLASNTNTVAQRLQSLLMEGGKDARAKPTPHKHLLSSS